MNEEALAHWGAVTPKEKNIYIYLVRSINQESSQYARKLGSLSGRNLVCVISGKNRNYTSFMF
jgi:hypothetical protein